VSGRSFAYNLRFPGQVFDGQAGLHANGYRDCYDPAIGRYCEPDPIGLLGRSYSTYSYGFQNPLWNVDPDGLAPPGVTSPGPGIPIGIPIPSIAIPGSPENAAWAHQAAQQIDDILKRTAQAIHDACTDDKKQHCEELLRIDTDTCNAITRRRGARAGEACHASATERYAACLRGRPLPPLNTWNN
jgi:RHS repeat-associated protein